MKKVIGLLICTSLILALSGCDTSGGTGGHTSGSTAGVADVLEAGKNAEEQTDEAVTENIETDSVKETGITENQDSEVTGPADKAEDEDPNTDPESSVHFDMASVDMDKIDVDLTALSATMVYSEVYNMMTVPDDYIGKVIKMNGSFTVFHDAGSSDYYFACLVKDATACCAQGIEFRLAGEHKFPEDYPYEGDEICVIGVYDTYKEGDNTYCTLKNAKIV